MATTGETSVFLSRHPPRQGSQRVARTVGAVRRRGSYYSRRARPHNERKRVLAIRRKNDRREYSLRAGRPVYAKDLWDAAVRDSAHYNRFHLANGAQRRTTGAAGSKRPAGLAGIDPKSTWDNAGEYSKTYFNTMIMDEAARSTLSDKAPIFYGRYGYQMSPYTAPSMYHPEGLGLMLFMTADENIEDFFPSTANYETQGYLSSTSRFDTLTWPVYADSFVEVYWERYISSYETSRRGKGYTRIW